MVVSLALSVPLASACGSPASAVAEETDKAAGFALSAQARDQLDAEVRRALDERLTPGVSVGIMRHGQSIFAEGFGQMNLETRTDAGPQSIYLIGSITKQFTAAAIVQLMEQGKLATEDPISSYFPDFPRGDEVTIRHLLYHTSGIHPISQLGGVPTPAQAVLLHDTADVIAFIAAQPNLFDFEPGTAREYSNSGYWLLGAIIEQVSGSSLREYLQQNLFGVAEMTTAAMDDEREVVPDRASGYVRLPDGDSFEKPEPAYLLVAGGAGGIRASVGDMLRWQDALLHEEIISAQGLALMAAPGTLDNGDPLPSGFGMMSGSKNGHAFYSASGGSTEGFTATLVSFPDLDVAYVVQTNIGPQPDAMRRISDVLDGIVTGL